MSAQSIGATTASGGETQSITSVVDGSGNIYEIGVLRATADLDPGAGVSYFVSNGQEDCYLVKYNSAGTFIWGRSFGAGGQDLPTSLAIDNSGNIIVSGYFSNTVDFDPGPGVTKLTSNGNYDIFISKFTPAGDLVFARSIGGITNDQANSMGLDASGNIYLTGILTSASADFDPGPGVVTLTRVGAVDAYVAKYDNNGNYVWAFNMGAATGSTQIYSNKIKVISNALYITGYLYGAAADFDPGPAVNNLGPVGATTATDIFLAKYDLSGNYTWGLTVGGDGTDIAYGLDTDASGNVYLAGNFEKTVDFNPAAAIANQISAGASDIFLAKYTAAGAYAWAIRMGSTGSEAAQALRVDAAGNPIIGGYFNGTVDFDPSAATVNLASAGSADGFIAKYTTAGAYTWAKKIGGTGYDRVGGLTTDASSNVIINGSFAGTVDFDPGAGVVNMTAPGTQTIGYQLKLNSAGNYLAAFAPNIPVNAPSNNLAAATWIDAGNNYYITGSFGRTVDFDPGPGVTSLTATGYADCFIAKYNAGGQLVFVRSIGNANGTQGKGIATDASGNIYVAGSFSGTVDFDPGAGTANRTSAGSDDLFLLKLNSSGNYVNAVVLGNSSYDVLSAMTVDNAGAVYLTGTFNGTVDFDPGAGVANRTAASGGDAFVAKYNSTLEFVFAAVLSGPSSETPTGITVDAAGNVYSTGSFWGTVDFDPGAAQANLTSAGVTDVYVSKLDANGNYVHAFRMGSTGSDAGGAIAVDATGNMYVAGQFNGTVDFDPGSGVIELTSAGMLDAFVAKYDAAGNYVAAKRFGGTLSDLATRMKLDARGNVYVAGQFSSTDWSMSLAGSTQTFPNEGNADVFLVIFDPALNYNGGRAIGGGQNDQPGGIAFDNADNIYLAGSFMASANIDNLAGTNAFPFRSINASDIFLARFEMLSMLPIKLEAFHALPVQAQVVVRWTVSAQLNNQYFEVERSADGQQYAPVGRIAGCLDCPYRMDYSFTDKEPLAGRSYYRLKQTDLDGSSTYSQVVPVSFAAAKGQLSVYPTVTAHTFTLSYVNPAGSSQQATVRVFNAAGHVVQTARLVLKPGTNTVPMTLASRAAGTYYVSLVIAGSHVAQHATVVKQ